MVDIADVKAWLDAVPGRSIGDECNEQWQRFAANDLPVVTVFGAYDTGKSSLLRRLIVESGERVPDWLTISARHETFAVDEVRAAGCVLRDTPGFVVGGSDVRAGLNTQLAGDAVGLTDVALVTVTPQLATAEYPALQELVREDWPAGSLWFGITRFDEAGVDPGNDFDGYRELAAGKTEELRTALALDGSIPVFVVSQDYAQLAGSDRNPDPSLWDLSRKWDGIEALREALVGLGEGDVGALRAAAAERFWSRAAATVVEQLRREAENYRGHADFSDEGYRLRQSWLSQLDALVGAAEADLRGRMSETIGDAVDLPSAAIFGERLSATVESWYSRQERNIDKLLQSVEATATTERQRPSWQRLDDLADAVHRGSPTVDDEAVEPEQTVTPMLRRIGEAALGALGAYDTYNRSRGRASAMSASSPVGDAVGAAGAALPFIVELASIAEEIYDRSSAAAARERIRREAEAEFDQVGQQAIVVAMEGFQPLPDAARDVINRATADQVDMRDALHKLVAELEGHAAAGDALLKAPAFEPS